MLICLGTEFFICWLIHLIDPGASKVIWVHVLVFALLTVLGLLKHCIVFNYCFFQIIQIKITVLISLEELVVSGILKNNNQKKPQDNLPIGDLCQLLTTSCDHTVALRTILEQTSSPVYTGMGRRALSRIELVDSSLCSLYGRVNGVNSPSCPCVTCSNMTAISAMLFWKHVATKTHQAELTSILYLITSVKEEI